eukprot:COSAG06_NODE_50734_length_316_cov_1.405530_2_plen_37_part_01
MLMYVAHGVGDTRGAAGVRKDRQNGPDGRRGRHSETD